MKKPVFAALILISFVALNVACVLSVKAQYQGDITINADGSVTPPTALIKQTGNIYTLTSDVDGTITVLRSNIIFDGNGHTISGILQIGSLAPTVGISYTSNVTVENFTVTGSYRGISLWQASNVRVANNTITGIENNLQLLLGGAAGIFVEGGGSNIITGNNLVNNYNGMSFFESINNLIIGNNITHSSSIIFFEASNNTFYHNNFVNNTAQAGDADSINVWDNGYPSGGNYWSDYRTRYPNATEIDGSGIGDTPYVIDAQNMDRYPLMEPYTEATYLLQTTPPEISVLNQRVAGSNVSLAFTVDKSVNWTGYSLDGKQNITITGNTTLTGLSDGLHNLTIYANDTYGNMGASETVTFTIPEPFPVVPVAVGSVAVAIVVVAGLLAYSKKRKH
jgi:parallel beta-helix repeat protein